MSPINFLKKIMRGRAVHDHKVRTGSEQNNMVLNPDEAFYARQYLYWIQGALKSAGKKSKLLDIGCGQGRLSVPLSADADSVVAVDFAPKSIAFAKEYAAQEGCSNIEFSVSDVLPYIKTVPAAHFDVIVFNEVTFFLPTYREVLSEIHRALKVGGYIFVSFRSQFFDILLSVQGQHWDSAQLAIDQREGYLWNGMTWFSWQTSEGIKKMLCDLGFTQIDCMGIGVCSGIEGDALASIARPSLLDSKAQQKLFELEIKIAHQYADCGRYILAQARKEH